MSILDFADRATEDLYNGIESSRVRRLPQNVRSRAQDKMDVLNAAVRLEDLAAVPGNRLERLHGNLKAFHSIKVNDQWRIVFRWTDHGPADVKLTDYH